ncbi:hypothetical protein GCK72_024055 [Caenorhabditis remanei]|uniref:VWFA domain-containing protein n=1 Tax=Caenorhabditis remanei TaxID=31234 RepID=A0A6A5FY46_CAERE|nr:hypothetical protein GCK72_024055 [Caenorhabditis remanei]KAF1747590.1 hypothetical protein GCK72_024055 [Caenorhabditis remanei]
MKTVVFLATLASIVFAAEQDLKFDVVFLIDSSKSSKPSYDLLTGFVQSLMKPYNVGLNGARVGLIAVAGTLEDQAPPAAELNSITSQNVLRSYLKLLKGNYDDFDIVGQCLTFDLKEVTSSDFISSGYRSEIQNHLLVYLTTSTAFDVDPVPTAEEILNSHRYGILTVGFGNDVDHQKLRIISGGSSCSFTASNSTGLDHLIKPIQRHIMNADANGGQYCNKKSHGTMAPTTLATQQTQGPNTQPPQTHSPVTALPSLSPSSALQFDIVFLIDGSRSAKDSFDFLTKFIQTIMVSFNVGLNGARVGLSVVAPDLEDQAPPAALLNSISSQSSLNSNLALLKDNYADFDHPGQVLTYNLQVVTSNDYMSATAGYRSNINNHVLVYITTTTAFYTDPTPSAQTIIAQKQYGIITVGYGAGFDNGKLQTISGGAACSFTATDFATLNNQIKPIQQLIINANTNGGNYCKSN